MGPYFDHPVEGLIESALSMMRFSVYDEDMEPLRRRIAKNKKSKKFIEQHKHALQGLNKPILSIRNEKLMNSS